MSRIGKKPIDVPKGVTLSSSGSTVSVKGPKGELSLELTLGITAEVKGDAIQVNRPGDSRDERARHGLYRALLQNMVTGVSEGFKKQLEIHGVGYRAEVNGSALSLQVGFCHGVEYHAPEGITLKAEQVGRGGIFLVTVEGIDRQLVGEVSAQIRSIRKPEPYKQKGIRYVGEEVRKLAGKSYAAGG